MPVLVGLFALGGVTPFTILLVQCLRSALRTFRKPGAGLIALVLAWLGLALVSAIDTSFAVLLVRAASLSLHSSAVVSHSAFGGVLP